MKIAVIRRFGFHPVLGEWFTGRFHEPTDVQTQAWTQIGEGIHTLISSPTGSGKTLAALLPRLDRIAKLKVSSSLSTSGVKVLYITPLKALNNDIHQHVFRFLEEIEELGAQSAFGEDETTGSENGKDRRKDQGQNPFGMLMPWPSGEKNISFSRKNGNYLVMKGASWLYWVENNCRRIYRIGQQEQSEEQIQEDLKTIFSICLRQHNLRKIIIESWNGTRITEAPEREYLLHLGAELDQTRYVLWPSQLS